ncbi:MAG: glutathione S-transferase family protein [Gammaproteobacteria bacterium]|nr:glutathione S-transferase family protein [Gammaproteobacteria bacterium]MBT3870667.1 glutathione S-transferase family protein [Gammaproteobacteria bacterium]MBT4377736.1 glutathione S-transferase family protein [Gammaproteobacteria bacterium]MBT4617850.1 glutathione S-transferase family protein [Gammaproteobacteria bacterium]MBT5442196.1 glutathione S-transferase family protein [Gammaproteobacteria bacterium]
MKLITGNLSPYSAKVRMQLYAMGIDDVEFDLPASFFMGKLSTYSPIGRIPVLEVEEGIVPESEVIAEYLDDCYPDKSMLGESPWIRSQVRLISRIADVYLMNNIFMALPQVNRKTRVDAVRDLLAGQVTRGMGALEQHIGQGDCAVGDKLTRADCTLVPALFLCERTVPMLDVENPILATTHVAAYWDKIQGNEFAAKVLDEMDRGLRERQDGTERKRIEAAIAKQKAQL